MDQLFQKFFQSKVSKMSVAGEEIAGLDITREAIRVAQVSQDKEENWILDKFSYRLLDQEKMADIVQQLVESKNTATSIKGDHDEIIQSVTYRNFCGSLCPRIKTDSIHESMGYQC